MRKTYAASIELEVEVDVDTDDEFAGQAQVVAAINREVIARMPPMVKGAWVAYAESEVDLDGARRKKT